MTAPHEPMPWEAKDASERVCPWCSAVVWILNHDEGKNTATITHAAPSCTEFTAWCEEHKTT